MNHRPIHPPDNQSATPQTLVCHPASPCSLALQIQVVLRRQADGLALDFEVLGPLSRLRLPPRRLPHATDGLWQHTCFEAFVATPGAAAYREFNWSPSGEWAHYVFAQERVRDLTPAQHPVPTSRLTQQPGRLLLQAHIPTSALPLERGLLLGLSAVIEIDDGSLSYWALLHPATQPDFHHRSGWQRLPAFSPLLSPLQSP